MYYVNCKKLLFLSLFKKTGNEFGARIIYQIWCGIKMVSIVFIPLILDM